MHEKLRQPDFNRHRNQKSLATLLDSGEIDICRPFAPWQLPDGPTWGEDPYKDDTWGLYYHALGWMIILDFGIDNAANQEAREVCASRLQILLKSYLAYLLDTPEAQTHKMVWFDHSTAWRASAIAYLYQKRFKASATPKDVALFSAAAKLHEAKLTGFIESKRWKANNHGIFHAEALWDMACVFEDSLNAEHIKSVALSSMRSVFSEMIDFEEGVCREQSFYYHLFDASLLVDTARYMGGFGVEVVPGYVKILAKMLDFHYTSCPDGGLLPAIGDTAFGKLADSRLLRNIHSAVPEDRARIAQARPAGPVLHSYPRNGYYFFQEAGSDGRPGSSAVFIDKRYHGAHGHNDGGSFTLAQGGEPMLVDSGGPYAYGKRLRFDYFKAAEAHNIAILGRKSRQFLTNATVSSESPLGACVRIATIDLDGGTWYRTVVSMRGGMYLLLDRFLLERPETIDVLFHAAPGVGGMLISGSHFRLQGASSSLDIRQASSTKFKLSQSAGEDAFPRGLVTRDLGQQEATPVLSTRLRARKAWLATLLGGPADIPPQFLSLNGGRMLRLLVFGEAPMGVDCLIDDPSVPVRIYTFRRH